MENKTQTSAKAQRSQLTPTASNKGLIIQYVIFIIIFTVIIGIFSLVMVGVASYRSLIDDSNFLSTSEVYNGPVSQRAPELGELPATSKLYSDNYLTKELVKRYLDNTALISTDGNVIITADFVKKGLSYQPSYKTQFYTKYLLKNFLNETSLIAFDFPFPNQTNSQEISNARLLVDGVEVPDAKTKITLSTYPATDYYYAGTQVDGLHWEGKIAANSQVTVEVSYNTVGLASFNYLGLENPKKSQDFKFALEILGTRAYNVASGLSKDGIEYGDNSVKLLWDKQDLYSTPTINVEVGTKLNPGNQVARVYFTMAPVYAVFAAVLLFLAYKFAKPLRIFDLFLITVLFVVYFPLIHYLASFTIDPTMEIFANMKNVKDFSMPLYGAFAIALAVVGGLIYYFLGKVSNFKFASKVGIPTLILFLGFFPLVVTIPEYSILLVLVGVIALIAIMTQVRVKMLQKE